MILLVSPVPVAILYFLIWFLFKSFVGRDDKFIRITSLLISFCLVVGGLHVIGYYFGDRPDDFLDILLPLLFLGAWIVGTAVISAILFFGISRFVFKNKLIGPIRTKSDLVLRIVGYIVFFALAYLINIYALSSWNYVAKDSFWHLIGLMK